MLHVRQQQQHALLHGPSWGAAHCMWRTVVPAKRHQAAITTTAAPAPAAAARGQQPAAPARSHLEPACSPLDPYTASPIEESVYTLLAAEGSSDEDAAPGCPTEALPPMSPHQEPASFADAAHKDIHISSQQPVWLQVYPCDSAGNSATRDGWTTDLEQGAAGAGDGCIKDSQEAAAADQAWHTPMSTADDNSHLPTTNGSSSSSRGDMSTAQQLPVGSYQPQRTAALAALREAQRKLDLASTAAAARQRVTYRWRVTQGMLAKAQEATPFRHVKAVQLRAPPQPASAGPAAAQAAAAPMQPPTGAGMGGIGGGGGVPWVGNGSAAAAASSGSSPSPATAAAGAGGGSTAPSPPPPATQQAGGGASEDAFAQQAVAAEDELQDLLRALAPDPPSAGLLGQDLVPGAPPAAVTTPVPTWSPAAWSSSIAALEQQQRLLDGGVVVPAAAGAAGASSSTQLPDSPSPPGTDSTSGSAGAGLSPPGAVQVAAWDASWPEYIQGQPDATNSQLVGLLAARGTQQPSLPGGQGGRQDTFTTSTGGSSSSSSSSIGALASGNAHQGGDSSMATAPSPPDPTYGLTLCVFVYCVGAQQLRRLLWSMGLPAGCVAFVARVADADVVLHQRAPRGTKQYQYDMYRKQAKDKGIPFISLTVVDQQELARWFLPIFALYAGRISPAALTQRRRPDRWGRRSHANIKM